MSSSTRVRNPRGEGATLRGQIIDATVRLIDGSHDEAQVSLRAIARSTGVAAPSIYTHFDDRDAVLSAALEHSWDALLASILASAMTGRTARSKLLKGCQAYVAFSQEHPLRYSLMTKTTLDSPAAQRTLSSLTTALGRCRDPRLRHPGPVTRAAAALTTALHGLAILHLSDAPSLWLGGFTGPQVLETLVDAAVAAQARYPLQHQHTRQS